MYKQQTNNIKKERKKETNKQKKEGRKKERKKKRKERALVGWLLLLLLSEATGCVHRACQVPQGARLAESSGNPKHSGEIVGGFVEGEDLCFGCELDEGSRGMPSRGQTQQELKERQSPECTRAP